MRTGALCCLALLAACGDDQPVTADAAVIDAALDAPLIDAPSGTPVTLTVTGPSGPHVGVRVIFQGSDSSLVADLRTGTDGKVSAYVGGGGFVTAIDPSGTLAKDLRTFAGVQPGDELLIGPPPPRDVTVQLRFPRAPDNTVTVYAIFDACAGYTGQTAADNSTTYTMTPNLCDGATDLLIQPQGVGSQSRSLVAMNVPVDVATGVDVTSGTYVPFATTTYDVTGATPTALLRVSPHGLIRSASLTMAGSSYAGQVDVMPGSVDVMYAPVGDSTLLHVQPTGTQHTVDLSGAVLPALTGIAFDAASHTASWSAAGVVQADVTLGHVQYMRAGQATSWLIAGPHDGNRFVLPVLPADLAALNPVTGDSVTAKAVVARVPGGYTRLRDAALLSYATTQTLESRVLAAVRKRATGIAGTVSYRPVVP